MVLKMYQTQQECKKYFVERKFIKIALLILFDEKCFFKFRRFLEVVVLLSG